MPTVYKRFRGENFAISPWLQGDPMIISSNLDIMRQVAYGSHRTDFEKPKEMSQALLYVHVPPILERARLVI